MEALEELRDQLAQAAEDTGAQVEDLEREDAVGLSAGVKVVARLEAGRNAASLVLAHAVTFRRPSARWTLLTWSRGGA